MYLTEKQKLILLVILKDSLPISDRGDNTFCICQELRKQLFEEIINQSEIEKDSFYGAVSIPCKKEIKCPQEKE